MTGRLVQLPFGEWVRASDVTRIEVVIESYYTLKIWVNHEVAHKQEFAYANKEKAYELRDEFAAKVNEALK